MKLILLVLQIPIPTLQYNFITISKKKKKKKSIQYPAVYKKRTERSTFNFPMLHFKLKYLSEKKL